MTPSLQTPMTPAAPDSPVALIPARLFEEHRPHLRAVAQRLLGSWEEADEAVRRARLRLTRAAPGPVPATDPLDGLASEAPVPDETGLASAPGDRLTAVLAGICLDLLRDREARRTAPWDPWTVAEPGRTHPAERGTDPEERALLTALDRLTPTERLVFVLHDLFAVPYEEIAPIVERPPALARRLAGRARRRVQGTEEMPAPDLPRQREVVAAFLAATRNGDAEALAELLDPEVVLRPDAAAARAGAAATHGPRPVAWAFTGRAARTARPALIDGAAGLVWAPDGNPTAACLFTVLDGRITAIDVLAERDHLDRLEVRLLDRRLHGSGTAR